MNHKAFTISSLILLIIIIPIVTLYNYYTITLPTNTTIRFALKPIPVSLMVLNIFIYFRIYRMHIYAMLVSGGLLFCLLGDILLMFYIPTLIPVIPEYNNIIFLIVGGISFFIGRGIMTLAFSVYPYRGSEVRHLKYGPAKLILSMLISFSYTTWLFIYFILNMSGSIVMKALVPIYFIMMGLQLFMSLMRTRGFDDETLRSQIFSVLGTALFNISDTLLFWDIFMSPIKYGSNISITLYWVGMFLISVSVVRGKNYETETLGSVSYLPLSNADQRYF